MSVVNHPKENKHIIALLLKYDLGRILLKCVSIHFPFRST